MKICQWKNRANSFSLIAVCLLGMAYFINYDLKYLVDTGVSVLNRGDTGSIERFLYHYGSNGAAVYIVLMAISILIPGFSPAPLYGAGHQLFGFSAGMLYGCIGGCLGVVSFLSVIKIPSSLIKSVQHRLINFSPDFKIDIRLLKWLALPGLLLSPALSIQVFRVFLFAVGISSISALLTIILSVSGLFIGNILAV